MSVKEVLRKLKKAFMNNNEALNYFIEWCNISCNAIYNLLGCR